MTNGQMGPPSGLQGVSSLLLLLAAGPLRAPIPWDFLRAWTVGSRSQSSDCLESRPLSSEESCTDTCLFSVAVFFVV